MDTLTIVSLIIGGGGAGGLWESWRRGRNERETWARDKRWDLCVSIISTVMQAESNVRIMVTMVEATGKAAIVPSLPIENYVSGVAAAAIIDRQFAEAYGRFADVWNEMLRTVQGQKIHVQLAALKEAQPALRVLRLELERRASVALGFPPRPPTD